MKIYPKHNMNEENSGFTAEEIRKGIMRKYIESL